MQKDSDEEKKLPELKEVTVKLNLDDVRKSVKYIPPELKGFKKVMREAIAFADFYNFSRNCEYIKYGRVYLGLIKMLEPLCGLYCTHLDNKCGFTLNEEGNFLTKIGVYHPGDHRLPEEIKKEIRGFCGRAVCPIYKYHHKPPVSKP